MQQAMEEEVAGRMDGDGASWASLKGTPDDAAYFHHWLEGQCGMIPCCVAGLLAVRDAHGAFVPVSKWPEGGEASALVEILEQVLEERCPLLTPLAGMAGRGHYALAYPVLTDGELLGAVAVAVAPEDEGGLRNAMAQLQWGGAWVELRCLQATSSAHEAEVHRMKDAVTLLADVLSEPGFTASAMAFVTRLSDRLGCERVSLGFEKRGRVQVEAVSHSAKFAHRMNLIRSMEKAMDEAMIQRREIHYPDDGEHGVIVMAHAEHATHFGGGRKLTLPIYTGGHYLGAVMLERSEAVDFSPEERAYCRSVVALSAPVLEQKRALDRPLALAITDAVAREVGKLLGPRHLGRKALVLLGAALLMFFSVTEGEYRLSSDVVLEGAIMRAVSAPFNGYVGASTLRAGDVVSKGDVLCRLDDRDLRLERLNCLNRRSQLNRKRQEAMAAYSRSEVNVLNAEIKQADAQLALTENNLARAEITAPFDGLLVSGDLTRSLGSTVQQGDLLFEITPLDAYRVILKVDESRIGDVVVGQTGRLVLSSLPGSPFGFRVTKITPISVAEEGRNYFRVEASLDTVTPQLRPGMEGVGKISVDRRNLFSIWTRSLRETIRLWVWSWRP